MDDRFYISVYLDTGRVFIYEVGVNNNIAEVFARDENETAFENAQFICTALNKIPNAQISGGTPSTESDCSVIEMGLCEVAHVMLRTNQLYRFIAMPGCDKCKSLDVYSSNAQISGGTPLSESDCLPGG